MTLSARLRQASNSKCLNRNRATRHPLTLFQSRQQSSQGHIQFLLKYLPLSEAQGQGTFRHAAGLE